jgi:hypothetical protein
MVKAVFEILETGQTGFTLRYSVIAVVQSEKLLAVNSHDPTVGVHKIMIEFSNSRNFSPIFL